jgi:hypothetical protein
MSNSRLTINQSELTTIIRNIFQSIVTPRLEKTFNEIYNGKSNKDSHIERINQLDTLAKLERKFKIISMVSIAKRPIVDINVQVTCVESGEVKYSLFGSDLRKYHMYLPKIRDQLTGRVFRPKVGTRYSRWYPDFMAPVMKNIALHLRMLDLYLKFNHMVITQDYSSSEIGILGLEVPFDIDEKYEEFFDIQEVECDSNPIKKSPGIFLFGKNGISHEIANQMANNVSKFTGFEHVYPNEIKESKQLIQFINSPQTIAIGTWNRHARILIKQTNIKTVEIIDPWKKIIEADFLLKCNNLACLIGWNVVFIKRKIEDQMCGENSCVLVAFARLMYLASKETKLYSYSYANYNNPIPDFYAFLASYLYRKTR